MKTSPFWRGDASTLFRNLIEEVMREIRGLDNQYVMKVAPTELEDHYTDKVKIEPLVLHSDQRYIEDQTPEQIDVSHDFRRVPPGQRAVVSGTCLTIAIPFEGTKRLWKIRPSTYGLSGYPEIEIHSDRITLSVKFADDSANPERLKLEIDRRIKSLTDAVGYLRNDVDNHNLSAVQRIRTAIEQKRKVAASTLNTVSALGIPLHRRGRPSTYILPITRRKIRVLPRVNSGPYQPEPALAQQEYEHILTVLRSMSLVIERNPLSFASLAEEDIRNHFLLQLNGHYQGSATGETFNLSGKTDILIRVENRNVFIAECKFWSGSKAFDEAVDQLLGYLSWRDTKAALLVFNKTKNFDAVRRKMHDVMETREEHRRTVKCEAGSDSQYVMVSPNDSNRELIVTTQVYDFPSTPGYQGPVSPK